MQIKTVNIMCILLVLSEFLIKLFINNLTVLNFKKKCYYSLLLTHCGSLTSKGYGVKYRQDNITCTQSILCSVYLLDFPVV